jgi:hypothetical protein
LPDALSNTTSNTLASVTVMLVRRGFLQYRQEIVNTWWDVNVNCSCMLVLGDVRNVVEFVIRAEQLPLVDQDDTDVVVPQAGLVGNQLQEVVGFRVLDDFTNRV